jgi:hypothetical protein
MLWAGFEPTIPVFERAKKIHALGRTATVIDGKDKKLSGEYNILFFFRIILMPSFVIYLHHMK